MNLPEDIERQIQLSLIRNETTFTLICYMYLSQDDNVRYLQNKWGLGVTGLVNDLIIDYPYRNFTFDWAKYHTSKDAFYLALEAGLTDEADAIYDSSEDKIGILTNYNQYNRLYSAVKSGYEYVIDYLERKITTYEAQNKVVIQQMRPNAMTDLGLIRVLSNGYLGRPLDRSLIYGFDSYFRTYLNGAVVGRQASVIESLPQIATPIYKTRLTNLVLGLPFDERMFALIKPYLNQAKTLRGFARTSATSGDMRTIRHIEPEGSQIYRIEDFLEVRLSKVTVELLEWMKTRFDDFSFWAELRYRPLAMDTQSLDVLNYLVRQGAITWDWYLDSAIRSGEALPSLVRHAIAGGADVIDMINLIKDKHPDMVNLLSLID